MIWMRAGFSRAAAVTTIPPGEDDDDPDPARIAGGAIESAPSAAGGSGKGGVGSGENVRGGVVEGAVGIAEDADGVEARGWTDAITLCDDRAIGW